MNGYTNYQFSNPLIQPPVTGIVLGGPSYPTLPYYLFKKEMERKGDVTYAPSGGGMEN